jgi:tartrate-resistant acid phosphatase type 5
MLGRRLLFLSLLPLAACGGAATLFDPGDGGVASDGGTDVAVAADAATDAPASADATSDAKADAPDAKIEEDGGPVMRFAVIGDYGNSSTRELLVANLVTSLNPEFIVTTGDNNYGNTSASYDINIGQYYHSFIAPYAGAYGAGAPGDVNVFFPVIGNHDWDIDGSQGYIDFFAQPVFHYELDKGPVHFVFVDSDVRQPDGNTFDGVQGQWAQAAIAASAAPFQFVLFHHPAYTSGPRTLVMDWPWKTWGADVVLTGHVHNYERLRSADGLSYFVVGQSGNDTHGFGAIHPSSQLRYNAQDGAQVVDVTATKARFRYYTVGGNLVDDYSIDSNGNPVP